MSRSETKRNKTKRLERRHETRKIRRDSGTHLKTTAANMSNGPRDEKGPPLLEQSDLTDSDDYLDGCR